MKVHITGKEGFIGQNLDIENFPIEKAEAVVHLGAISGIDDCAKNPMFTWECNVTDTLSLLEKCKILGIRKFLFASTNASRYNLYGFTKFVCEKMTELYPDINSIIMKFSNVYGPHMEHKKSVIPTFIRCIEENKPIIIHGNGEQTRDFVYVSDVCNTIKSLLERYYPHPMIRIGSGKKTSINELVDILKKIYNKDIHVQYSGEAIYSESIGTDIIPKIKLEEGLQYTIQSLYTNNTQV